MSLSNTKACPRCAGVAPLLQPMKVTDKRIAVYGCKACGYAFKEDGTVYVSDAKELKDYFRGGTMANKTLMEALAGENLNPATKILLQARLVEYGMQMWFDGLKQGLVMGAASAQTLEGLAREVLESPTDGTEDALRALHVYLNPEGKPHA